MNRFIKVILTDGKDYNKRQVINRLFEKKLYPKVGDQTDPTAVIKFVPNAVKEYKDENGITVRTVPYDLYEVAKDKDIRLYYIPFEFNNNEIVLYWRTELADVDTDDELDDLKDLLDIYKTEFDIDYDLIILTPQMEKKHSSIVDMYRYRTSLYTHVEWVQPSYAFLKRVDI